MKAIGHAIVAVFFAATCANLTFAEPPNTNALDSETRKRIEQSLSAIGADARQFLLKRIEEAPKTRGTLDGVTVYSNGVVSRYTITTRLSFDFRLNHQARSFSLGGLTDDKGNRWGVPSLTGCSLFNWPKNDDTFLFKSGTRVRLVHVDTFKSPQLVRSDSGERQSEARPARLNYDLAAWYTVYSADTLQMVHDRACYMLGRGTVEIEWKDGPVPAGWKSHVIESISLPKN
jgi:hypothetical protein